MPSGAWGGPGTAAAPPPRGSAVPPLARVIATRPLLELRVLRLLPRAARRNFARLLRSLSKQTLSLYRQGGLFPSPIRREGPRGDQPNSWKWVANHTHLA